MQLVVYCKTYRKEETKREIGDRLDRDKHLNKGYLIYTHIYI